MLKRLSMYDAADGSFKLCHYETEHTLSLAEGDQYVSGTGIVVKYDKESGIMWYVDETTGALETQINNLCIRQRPGRSFSCCISC